MANIEGEVKGGVSETVEIGRLRPNPWNTNVMTPENEAKLEVSLKRFGMFRPLVVRTTKNGELEILGGQHRWEVAQKLGMKHVPVFNMGQISEETAKEVGLVDNGRYGQDDTLALSDLLKELGMNSDVTSFLPYSDLELASILNTSSIGFDDLSIDPDADLPPLPATKAPPTHQIMRFKVPVEDIAWITSLIETTMRTQNYSSDDSLTNAGNGLVHILKGHK